MQRIIFIISTSLPRKFTRKEFNSTIRKHSITSHPEHYLQRLVQMGRIKRIGSATYQQV